MKKFLLLLVSFCLVGSALAQGFGSQGGFGGGSAFGMGAGGPMTMLLMDPQVNEELKLTDEQKTKLAEAGKSIGDEVRRSFMEAGGDQSKIQKAIEGVVEKVTKIQMTILTPEQSKRLKEIYIQDNGYAAAANKEIQADLKLTPEQLTKITTLQTNLSAATKALGDRLRNQEIDFARFQDASAKNTKILKDELGKILTEPQRKKLKEMEGKPFTRKKSGS